MDLFFAFLPPPPPPTLTTEKIKVFKKWNKNSGDIIILHMYTINANHMMYSSWDMKRDGLNFWSFWTVFWHFTSLTTRKIKILKNWKQHLEISLFYTSATKIMIICYTVPEIWCVTDVIIFYFGPFFALLPLTGQKIKILKKFIKSLEISSFHTKVPKSRSYPILFLRHGT